MKSITLLIFYMVSILAYTDISWAHGISGRVIEKTALLVEAEYDDGEPMSYAAVEILNLKEKLPFQSGRTDKNGRFMFLPDQSGDWQVVVNDGMGHRLALNTSVNENMGMDRKSDQNNIASHAGSFARHENILMGISFIFGIFGFLFWWKGRKNNPGH